MYKVEHKMDILPSNCGEVLLKLAAKIALEGSPIGSRDYAHFLDEKRDALENRERETVYDNFESCDTRDLQDNERDAGFSIFTKTLRVEKIEWDIYGIE